MRNPILLFAIAACLFAAGCATVETSKKGDKTLVSIANNGWYLFNFIPIASGNPMEPNANSTKFFSKTVTLDNNIKMLDYALRKENASGFKNVVSHTTDETFLFLLVKRHACHTSAELVYDIDPLWKTLP